MKDETKIKISESEKGKIVSKHTSQKIKLGLNKYYKMKRRKAFIVKGNYENYILDECEKLYGMKIERCYKILSYFVDGYIKQLNLVIEVDEDLHFNRDGTYKEKDIIRQTKIEKYLGCQFLRIRIKEI